MLRSHTLPKLFTPFPLALALVAFVVARCQPSTAKAVGAAGAESCTEDYEEEVSLFQLYQRQHQRFSRPTSSAIEFAGWRLGGRQQNSPRQPPLLGQQQQQLWLQQRQRQPPQFNKDVEYVFLVFAVLAVLTLLYLNKSRGLVPCLAIAVFVCSQVAATLVPLWLVKDFPYVPFSTAPGFLISSGLTLCYVWVCNLPFVVPTLHDFSYRLIPSAFGIGSSVFFMLKALEYIPASFVAMLQSTSCLFSLLLSFAFGMQSHISLIPPMMLLAGGTAFAVEGETGFSWVGFLLTLASNFAMAAYGVLMQVFMATASSGSQPQYDRCTTCLWSGICSAVIMLAMSLMVDGLAPLRFLVAMDASHWHACFPKFLALWTATVLLSFSSISVIQDLGAVTYQVMFLAAGIFTVCGGVMIFDETVATVQFVGYTAILGGVAWHCYAINEMRQLSEDKDRVENNAID